MSALDDAIATHLAHPAGAGTDCLTDSLCHEQIATQPAPLHIREGWENEPIDPGHPWLLYLVAFLIGLLGFGAISGCGGDCDPDDDGHGATTQPVHCKDHPEIC